MMTEHSHRFFFLRFADRLTRAQRRLSRQWKAALVHGSLWCLLGKVDKGKCFCPGNQMPLKAIEARRHKIPKARYRMSNGHEYDQALPERGS